MKFKKFVLEMTALALFLVSMGFFAKFLIEVFLGPEVQTQTVLLTLLPALLGIGVTSYPVWMKKLGKK